MSILKLLFTKISGTTLFIVGALAGATAAFWKGYLEGIEREQLRQKEREHDAQKTRADVAEKVSSMSDDAVTDELREHIQKRDT